MVSKGSDKQPSQYSILCGKLTAAEICRLLSKRGLDDIASITAAGKPLDGLKTVWACYTIAAENGFTTPYNSEIALAAKSSIDKLDELKTKLNAVNRKIAAAKKTAEVIYRANNPEPVEADYPNGGLAAAREAWYVALVAARNDTETSEMREAYNSANEAYNLEKITYIKSCLNFDSAYMKALDERRAGLSPLKQCGEDANTNA